VEPLLWLGILLALLIMLLIIGWCYILAPRGQLAVLLNTAFGIKIFLVVIRKQFFIQAIVVVSS